ncbi:MAG: undecaprenyldiphospho-muramoylpentapeptide beta-N-acetylglucosaminyltransferase [Endomicrobium sp.]|jgi:UDP-N-acetylglucosamine--N-acetylmuramyl-(pentapeptide) pyrophosphoryl-undecaprenol N-acetylglucosamine transferase|nr:undecaprenyldiphospho-muramoylpentapeptide beta-N-acetylglucosaminyltransferase [Endomicrobium sp.]
MQSGNIIIASSGTGGHIYPGIAVARELEKKGFKAVFFISSNAASLEIMKDEGFEYVAFNLAGMPRKVSFSFAVFAVKLTAAFFKSLKYILKFKARAVFGAGGYISVPAACAAWFLRKKIYIHEQNSLAGAANKFLNLIASKTFISFEGGKKYFKKKNLVLSGYPVRKEILSVSKQEACDALGVAQNIFTVLIFGGSLGAVKLNEIAVKAMAELSSKENIQVLHITGLKNYDEVSASVKNKKNYKIFAYMRDIKYAYCASDAVISRAGAGAVFELKALNKPAVLTPYPYAAGNHQFYNAKELDGAIIIEEKDLTPQNLCEAVIKLKNASKQEVSAQKPSHKDALLGQVLPAQEIIANTIDGELGLRNG